MSYQVAIVSSHEPGRVTMQADVETWRRVWAALRAGLSASTLARFGAEPDGDDAAVVRVSFTTDNARMLYGILGIAG